LGAEQEASTQVLSLYIPDKNRRGRRINTRPWIREAQEILTRIGEGYTTTPPYDGGWESEGGTVRREKTVIVYTYIKPDRFLAHEVVPRENAQGAPISLHALRRELETRVRSTGGRPALEGATKIQKIPLKPEDWSRLEELAAQLSRQGVSATAGQVASVMVHNQLELLVPPTARHKQASRRTRARPATGPG